MVNRNFRQPARLDQHLERVEARLRAALSGIEDIRKAMAAQADRDEPVTAAPRPARPAHIAFANGRRLTAEEYAEIDERDYDVILDLANRTLRVKGKPGTRTKPEPASLMHIGGHRIDVLAYMLTHPGRHFTHTAVYGRFDEIRGPNTFAKTIGTLRQALGTPGGRNPYILTVPAWEDSAQPRAGVYVLNDKYNYLVIRASEEITGNSL